MQTLKKIIFAGLDNSGKTSIILSLQQKFSYFNTKPTLGLIRSKFSTVDCLGFGIVLWDLGAQKKFRKNYFKQRYQVFSNTASLFYVIDIQDTKRFEESIEYLSKIVDTLEDLDENPEIILCFHKIDPDISNKAESLEIIEYLKNLIKSLSINFKLSFFNTSIYDLSSLFLAFSKGIVHFSPLIFLIDEQLGEFAKLSNSSAVLLMSEDLLIIGSHSTQKFYIELCEVVGLRFLNIMESFNSNSVNLHNIYVDVKYKPNILISSKKRKNLFKKAKILMTSFETSNQIRFYVIILIKDNLFSKFNENLLPTLINHLSSMMYVVTQDS